MCMDMTAVLSQIDSEISKLQHARQVLAGHNSGNGRTPVRKKSKMSAAGRARIAAAQRKRWAKQKRAAK